MRFLPAILLLLFALPAHAQGQGQGMSNALVVSSCGTQALPSGSLTNLTMNPQGQLCLVGISTGFCQPAVNYLGRTTGGNEGGNATNIANLICGLVSDGVIDGTLAGARGCGTHLDALHILAQQNATDARLNLCGTSYGLTVVASPTFIGPYQCYSFSAPVGYFDTGFNASTATSPNFTQNSANFGFWSKLVVDENSSQMGTGATNQIYDSFSVSNFYARVNNASIAAVPTPGTKGLFSGDRSSSAAVVPYWNGIAQVSQPGASGAVDNASFTVGFNATAVTAQTLCEDHIGGSLGPALNLALYNRLRTYMTAVGVP